MLQLFGINACQVLNITQKCHHIIDIDLYSSCKLLFSKVHKINIPCPFQELIKFLSKVLVYFLI